MFRLTKSFEYLSCSSSPEKFCKSSFNSYDPDVIHINKS